MTSLPLERRLAIQYGDVLIGGSSPNLLLTGKYRDAFEADDGQVEFEFIVSESFPEAFAKTVERVESVLSAPYLDLRVTQGGTTLVKAIHSSDAGGFDTFPRLEKLGGEEDAAVSRRYRCVIDFGKPADNRVFDFGVRRSEVTTEFDGSRIGTVRISGTYTSVGGISARTQYRAAIEGFVNGKLSGLGLGTVELIEEREGPRNSTGKLLDFERVYREIIHNQGKGVLNDLDLINPTMRLTRLDENLSDTNRPPKGGTGTKNAGFVSNTNTGTSAQTTEVRRLSRFRATYSAGVDQTRTTDLTNISNRVRQFLADELKRTFNLGDKVAVVIEDRSPQPYENRIDAVIEAWAAVNNQTIIEREVTLQDSARETLTWRPAWTGNALSYYGYEGVAEVTRTYTERIVQLGDFSINDAASRGFSMVPGGKPQIPGVSADGEWFFDSQQPSVRPIRYGTPQDKIEATEAIISTTMRYVKREQGSGGRGGGTPRGNPGQARGSGISSVGGTSAVVRS